MPWCQSSLSAAAHPTPEVCDPPTTLPPYKKAPTPSRCPNKARVTPHSTAGMSPLGSATRAQSRAFLPVFAAYYPRSHGRPTVRFSTRRSPRPGAPRCTHPPPPVPAPPGRFEIAPPRPGRAAGAAAGPIARLRPPRRLAVQYRGRRTGAARQVPAVSERANQCARGFGARGCARGAVRQSVGGVTGGQKGVAMAVVSMDRVR